MAAGLFLLVSCTQSPFDEGGIVPPTRDLRGTVELSDAADPEGVYVWLEGTSVATRTEADGSFRLTLPPATTTEMGGVFDLFFYVANYKLASARVVIQDGRFLPSRGDVNANNELVRTQSLFKLLRIRTLVDPPGVPTNYEGPIDVQVTLQATLDTVTVVFPKMVGGLLGAIILRRLGTEDVFVDIPDIGARTRAVEKVGLEPRSWRMVFNLRRGALPEGEYEVIPYFFIEQEEFPPGLLASLGPDVEKIGPGYLKIPFRREGGRLVIGD
jgi:hypothetical protein